MTLPVDVREDWWVDDWLVTDGWVRDVEMRTGLYQSAAKRGQNALVANRTGQLWTPKTFDQGTFTLNVWLGDDTRTQVEQWWDLFLRAVSPGHRLCRYRRTLAGGGSRYCDGEVTQQISPTSLGIRAAVEVQVPEGVWWDGGGEVSESTVAGAGLWQTLTLDAFALVTAPQERLVSRVEGPINNPQVIDVTDGVDGEWWTYDGALTAGQSIVVGGGPDGWDLTGFGGFVPDPAKLRYSGATYLIVPPAKIGNVPTVQLRGSGGGAGTRLTISGTPCWLV
jgi:hypothetical protein